MAEEVSRALQRWAPYYRSGNSARCFSSVDCYAHERLALFASAKHGRSGRGWSSRPGLIGGRWRRGSHGEPEDAPTGKTGGIEPGRLSLADQPAAYLTGAQVAC
ncbi:MAG: hypothetical protein HYU54_07810 [Actinobacteria bacterium]|nr:hypothetical protein [Actinomycetota bacterium]